ncbi:hypothetical protein [Chitinasiproducens palmae]|uniref:Uncharacterized protein n=1 Tax=Chitinasiproducens palmae TaxID=1770053 RepID=A0A1H2PSE6_9BURK|nr:hypothetical protein SAMN05216551_109211 [Chitinasiproducens palmae]
MAISIRLAATGNTTKQNNDARSEGYSATSVKRALGGQLLKMVARPRVENALSRRPAVRSMTFAPNVRVYRGPSRTTMVGTFAAVCSMLDRCVAEDEAGHRVASAI